MFQVDVEQLLMSEYSVHFLYSNDMSPSTTPNNVNGVTNSPISITIGVTATTTKNHEF